MILISGLLLLLKKNLKNSKGVGGGGGKAPLFNNSKGIVNIGMI